MICELLVPFVGVEVWSPLTPSNGRMSLPIWLSLRKGMDAPTPPVHGMSLLRKTISVRPSSSKVAVSCAQSGAANSRQSPEVVLGIVR